MDSASRDAFLRLILPAVAVVGIYSYWFNKQPELTQARTTLENARASAVGPTALFPVRKQLGDLARKETELKQAKSGIEERWSRMTALPEAGAAKRAASVRQLTRMLWDRGLLPFDESADATEVGTPASFDDAVRRLTAKGGATGGKRLWKVRFYGRYADVADTLSAIGDLDAAMVPVGLTMSETNLDTEWRMWTLVLWI